MTKKQIIKHAIYFTKLAVLLCGGFLGIALVDVGYEVESHITMMLGLALNFGCLIYFGSLDEKKELKV